MQVSSCRPYYLIAIAQFLLLLLYKDFVQVQDFHLLHT